uniref:G-type lectin S-receptor-like serine/threonine-protein kinase SD2-5 n=1 Tax=Erigeron canadensis TaxID=72917 RepID=UPI001CB98468|nr:G-type lectin S-receptor-like serine/threonine-protein kinase SD2-5 [Erigeron canadensis]
MAPSIALFISILSILPLHTPTAAHIPNDYSTTNIANLSTTWTNDESAPNSFNFQDGSMVISIFFMSSSSSSSSVEPKFGCGFICNGTCLLYHFGIFIIIVDPVDFGSVPPQVVWLANRDDPVGLGATLSLTAAGELVLRNYVGTTVWTSNTAGKSVIGMNLTDTGNLVLFDPHGSVVWQSFDYPTDSLLPGQKLSQGQKLIASVSSSNWTTQQSLYSFTVSLHGLYAFFESNSHQYAYYNSSVRYANMPGEEDKIISHVRFLNGSLSVIYTKKTGSFRGFDIPFTSSMSYIKLMSDGHLKMFEWKKEWSVVADLLSAYGDSCHTYPLACGRNALCINDNCECPGATNFPVKDYFRSVNEKEPYLGCYETIPITCNATQDQDFIDLGDHFEHFTFQVDKEAVDLETCKQACLNNCACKAVVFQYNGTAGNCYLPSELLTLKSYSTKASRVFIKVQKALPLDTFQASGQLIDKNFHVEKALGIAIGSFLSLLAVVGFIVFVIRKRKRKSEIEEECLDQVAGMPTRFSYEELKTATDNFSKSLGQGGFGSVFEGILEDGMKIAVKCLEDVAQVKKSFLAEVQSIGNIHHVNLVRLIGFCAWKSKRLLVYEFMGNGSLERWIYHGDGEHMLEWAYRKKIILDIAKGLAYLHEDCRQKIIHLDIKPQNILLDDHFNAKVSDFGLSKLIERNQTQVMTTMRGTPGYLAPEWLSSVITEKVDVYSFGILLLEILCGRKNFDISEPEESQHLLKLLQKSWQQGMLLDMVDKYSEDMQAHGAEVVEMLKLASWCLQTDYTERPSMSSVVKVIEGGLNVVESNLDYNFTDPRMQKKAVGHEEELTQLFPSLLSGPR